MTGRSRWSRLRPLLLAGTVALAGCGNQAEGQQYRAERDFFKANRAARRLDVNPELVGSADYLDVGDAFRRVGDRFDDALADGDTARASQAEEAVALLSARAHLAAVDFYLRGEEYDLALNVAERVRTRMPWAAGPAIDSQRSVVEALIRKGELGHALRELWRLADEHEPVMADGQRVRTPVFNAPLRAVAVQRDLGDSLAVADAVTRAVAYYEAVGTDHAGQAPALLADLNRASLLAGRGDWQEAAAVLESALDGYPDDVLQDSDVAMVAYNLARIYLTDDRDLDRARDRLELTRDRGGDTEVAADASLALGSLAAREGNTARALDLYAEVASTFDTDERRAPLALFNRGRLLERADRWEEALSEYRALEATYPRSSQAFEVPFVVAAHYRSSGSSELADSVLRRAGEAFAAVISQKPSTGEAFRAHHFLIRTELERERWGAAVGAMTEFARAFPGHRESALALLDAARMSRDRLDDRDGFLQLVSEVETVYPNSPFAEAAQQLREGS